MSSRQATPMTFPTDWQEPTSGKDRLGPNELLSPTRQALQAVASRRAWMQFLRGTALGGICLLAGAVCLMAIDHFLRPEAAWRAGLSGLLLVAAFATAWRFGWSASLRRDRVAAARRIRDAVPQWGDSLLAAVELAGQQTPQGSPALRQHLQREVAARMTELSVNEVLPWRLIRRPISWAATALLIAVSFASIDAFQVSTRVGRLVQPFAPIDPVSSTRITLKQPLPASATVPAGEWVAVVAEVSGSDVDRVELQWQEEAGSRREVLMRRRNASENVSPEKGQPGVFSTSMSLEDRPVRYRIVAGDGQTSWHTLTPQRRPQVQQFVIRVGFPNYTGLPEVVRRSSSGDIQTLAGADATVEVRFDRPVRDAVAQLSDDRLSVQMTPQPDDRSNSLAEKGSDPLQRGRKPNDTDSPPKGLTPFRISSKWLVRLPVNRDYRYRIEASGTDGMVTSPTDAWSSIRAVPDQPPLAKWLNVPTSVALVSGDESLKLTALLSDDLPFQTVVQQIMLPDEKLLRREISTAEIQVTGSIDPETLVVDAADQDHKTDRIASSEQSGAVNSSFDRYQVVAEWDWSLTSLQAESEGDLPAGTRVRTRVVTVDRAGQRGASSWREFLITDRSTRPQMLEEAARQRQLIQAVKSWIDTFRQQLEALDRSDAKSLDVPLFNTIAMMADRWGEISAIREGLPIGPSVDGLDTDPPGSTATLTRQLTGNDDLAAVERWAAIDRSIAAALQSLAVAAPSELPKVIAQVEATLSAVNKLAESIGDVEEANVVAIELSRLKTAMRRLADPDSKVPVVRLPAQADIVIQQWKRLGRFVEQLKRQAEGGGDLDESVDRLIQQTVLSIQAAVRDLREEPGANPEVAFCDSLRRLADEVDDGRSDRAVNPLAVHSILSSLRSLSRPEVAFAEPVTRTASRLAQRPDTDVRSMADLYLIEEVTAMIEAEQSSQSELNTAIETLRVGIELKQLRRLLDQIESLERYLFDSFQRRAAQGVRLEQYAVVLDQMLSRWEGLGNSAQVSQLLRQTISGPDYAAARDRLVSRGDAQDASASAAEPLSALQANWRDARPEIEKTISAARQALESWRPKASELARAAARLAEKGVTQIQKDSQPVLDSEERNEWTQRLQASTRRLGRRLIDQANTLDYADQQESALARYLDRAVRAVAEQTAEALQDLRRAEFATTQWAGQDDAAKETKPESAWEDAEQSLVELQGTLLKLADDLSRQESEKAFAANISNDSTPGSPDQQDLSNALGEADELSRSFQAAQSAAEDAVESPRELLRRLEQILRRDQPMQSELKRIADQTALAVEQSLANAAQRQRQLRRYLEQADPEREQLRQDLARRLADVADLADALDDSWIQASMKAALNESQAADETAEPQQSDSDPNRAASSLPERREQLARATQQIRNTDSTVAGLNDWRQLAEQLRQALQAITKTQPADLPEDKTSGGLSPDQVQAAARQIRNEWLKYLKGDTQRLVELADQAAARQRDLSEQRRQLEKAAETARSRAERQPQSQTLRIIADRAMQRAETARRAVEAAEKQQKRIDELSQRSRQRWQEATDASVQNLGTLSPENAEPVWRRKAARQSARWATSLADELNAWLEMADDLGSLAVDAATADRFADQQQQARRAVARMADDLRRVSRHRQRLAEAKRATQTQANPRVGEDAAQEEASADEATLRRLASLLEQTWDQPMRQALATAGNNSDGDPIETTAGRSALEALRRAAARLDAAAGEMGELNDQANRSEGSPAESPVVDSVSGDAAAPSTRSRQLARTLDELDRYTTRSFGQTSGEESEPATAGSATAGDASPSAAEAARAARRQLADQRESRAGSLLGKGPTRESVGDPSGKDSASASSTSVAADSPASADSNQNDRSTGSGTSAAAAGAASTTDGSAGSIGSTVWPGSGTGRWSALRQQATEGLSGERRNSVPMPYRPAVEAYFRQIATESAAQQQRGRP